MRTVNIPRSVTFPGGYTVKIKQLRGKALQAAYQGWCQHCGEPNPESSWNAVDGWWDQEEMTIFINQALAKEKKVGVLKHELLHAIWDWVDARY